MHFDVQNAEKVLTVYYDGYYGGIITYLEVENPGISKKEIAKKLRIFNQKLDVPRDDVDDYITYFMGCDDDE